MAAIEDRSGARAGAAITRCRKRISGPLLDRIVIPSMARERIEAAHLAEAVQYRPRQVI